MKLSTVKLKYKNQVMTVLLLYYFFIGTRCPLIELNYLIQALIKNN